MRNRCTPCTIGMAAIAAVLTGAPVLAGPELGSSPLAYDAVRDRATGERFVLRDLAVERNPGDLRTLDLALERFEILGRDAVIVVGSGPGERLIAPPDLVLLRGTVIGEAGSRVFAAISPYGTNGFIDAPSGTVSISSGAPGDAALPIRAADTGMIGFDPNAPALTCITPDGTDDPDAGPLGPAPHDDGFVANPIGGPCRIADIAVDTDWEFTLDQGGDPVAGTAYALTLIAASSEIYRSNINLRLSVSFLRVFENGNDPWTATSSGEALGEVRDHWVSSMGGIDRDLVHFLSGKSLGGGVAWVDVVCSNNSGYAVSGSLNGFFPYPLDDYNGANWDIVVVSHELGHNFGSPHTHSYNPPLDGCGNGDCSDSFGGTIMSYCHLCSPGMSNIQLAFHPTVQTHLLLDLADSCSLLASGQAALDDRASTTTGVPIDIDVLWNDEQESCGTVVLASFDPFTSAGGTVGLVPASPSWPRDRVRVTPGAPSGVETLTYSIGGQSATVIVTVDAMGGCCFADDTCSFMDPELCSTLGGNYRGDGSQCDPLPCPGACCLPSGVCMELSASDCENGGGLFLGLSAGCAGVSCPAPTGACCLADGTCLVVDDAVCTIVGGTFEGGGSDCATSACGTAPCAGDVNGDGLVGFEDLVAILSAWGPCAACAEDFDDSGAVDFADLVLLLAAWGPCG